MKRRGSNHERMFEISQMLFWGGCGRTGTHRRDRGLRVERKEAKDRVSTAIANSGFARPETNITVNLAPADVRKEGPIYDLPIAVCLLAAADRVKCPDLAEWGLIGELALSGEVRRVRGVLPIVMEMRRIGRKGVFSRGLCWRGETQATISPTSRDRGSQSGRLRWRSPGGTIC